MAGKGTQRPVREAPIETARDIAIIILAVLNIVQAILWVTILGLLLMFGVKKIPPLWRKIEAIIDKAGDTAGTVAETTHTVSATTSYVSSSVVAPLIKLIAFIMGIRRALAVLFTGPQVPESGEGGS